MRESYSSPNLSQTTLRQSVRVKNRQQVIGNRNSDKFNINHANDEVINDLKEDTLDHVTVGDRVQHSLRSLLRQKYWQETQTRIFTTDNTENTDCHLMDPAPQEMIDQNPQDNFFAGKRWQLILCFCVHNTITGSL